MELAEDRTEIQFDQVVLRKIFNYLSISELIVAALVSKFWDNTSSQLLDRKTLRKLKLLHRTELKETLPRNCLKVHPLNNKLYLFSSITGELKVLSEPKKEKESTNSDKFSFKDEDVSRVSQKTKRKFNNSPDIVNYHFKPKGEIEIFIGSKKKIVLEGHPKKAYQLIIERNRNDTNSIDRFISVGKDHTIKIWNSDGVCQNSLIISLQYYFPRVVLRLVENKLYCAIDEELHLYDLEHDELDLKKKQKCHETTITVLKIVSNSNILTAASNSIKIWDKNFDNCITEFKPIEGIQQEISVVKTWKDIIFSCLGPKVVIYNRNGSILKEIDAEHNISSLEVYQEKLFFTSYTPGITINDKMNSEITILPVRYHEFNIFQNLSLTAFAQHLEYGRSGSLKVAGTNPLSEVLKKLNTGADKYYLVVKETSLKILNPVNQFKSQKLYQYSFICSLGKSSYQVFHEIKDAQEQLIAIGISVIVSVIKPADGPLRSNPVLISELNLPEPITTQISSEYKNQILASKNINFEYNPKVETYTKEFTITGSSLDGNMHVNHSKWVCFFEDTCFEIFQCSPFANPIFNQVAGSQVSIVHVTFLNEGFYNDTVIVTITPNFTTENEVVFEASITNLNSKKILVKIKTIQPKTNKIMPKL